MSWETSKYDTVKDDAAYFYYFNAFCSRKRCEEKISEMYKDPKFKRSWKPLVSVRTRGFAEGICPGEMSLACAMNSTRLGLFAL